MLAHTRGTRDHRFTRWSSSESASFTSPVRDASSASSAAKSSRSQSAVGSISAARRIRATRFSAPSPRSAPSRSAGSNAVGATANASRHAPGTDDADAEDLLRVRRVGMRDGAHHLSHSAGGFYVAGGNHEGSFSRRRLKSATMRADPVRTEKFP